MDIKPLKIGDLTIKIPVIQGGMGVGVSLSRLAGAVALEGGVGIISTAQIGYKYPEFDKNPIETNLRAIADEIAKAKEIAKGGVIGVNIMVATKRYEDYVKAAVAAGADIIISGAGLPMDLPKLTEGTKTKIAPIVSSLKSCSVICKYWLKKFNRLPDAVVVEGPRAGGHLGFRKEELEDIKSIHFEDEMKKIIKHVKEVAVSKAVEIPVIMAGGIFDKKDMEDALALGADGVQVATRFVTTYECDASEAYKQAYLDAKREDIVIVQSPVGMPGRAIINDFIRRAREGNIPHGACKMCVSTCDPSKTPYCITEALVNAVKGDIQNGLLFCGENAYRADKMEHVSEIMKEFSE